MTNLFLGTGRMGINRYWRKLRSIYKWFCSSLHNSWTQLSWAAACNHISNIDGGQSVRSQLLCLEGQRADKTAPRSDGCCSNSAQRFGLRAHCINVHFKPRQIDAAYLMWNSCSTLHGSVLRLISTCSLLHFWRQYQHLKLLTKAAMRKKREQHLVSAAIFSNEL